MRSNGKSRFVLEFCRRGDDEVEWRIPQLVQPVTTKAVAKKSGCTQKLVRGVYARHRDKEGSEEGAL